MQFITKMKKYMRFTVSSVYLGSDDHQARKEKD